MINAAIALVVLKVMDRRWPRLAPVAIPEKTVAWTSAIAGTVTVVWVGSSLLIYAQVNADMGSTVRVAAIQPGHQDEPPAFISGTADTGVSPADNQARRDRQKVHLVSMTKEAASQGARLIVWPEEVLDYDPLVAGRGDWIGELAKSTDATIVVGFQQDPTLGLETPNVAVTYLPTGQVAGDPYYKVHPVVAHSEAFRTPSEYPRYQTPYPTYRTPVGQLGVVLCWDHEFPNSVVRLEAATGANIMAVSAWDPASMAPLRWQALVFRAAENKIPMVKADMASDSTIVNANGDVVASSVNDQRQSVLLVGDVNPGPRGAFFSDTGGLPVRGAGDRRVDRPLRPPDLPGASRTCRVVAERNCHPGLVTVAAASTCPRGLRAIGRAGQSSATGRVSPRGLQVGPSIGVVIQEGIACLAAVRLSDTIRAVVGGPGG